MMNITNLKQIISENEKSLSEAILNCGVKFLSFADGDFHIRDRDVSLLIVTAPIGVCEKNFFEGELYRTADIDEDSVYKKYSEQLNVLNKTLIDWLRVECRVRVNIEMISAEGIFTLNIDTDNGLIKPFAVLPIKALENIYEE